MKRTNKKGFTIVELVIVIAVIAILAAVLIPNISRLVKKAQISSDLSLVRNLNMALETESATMDYPTAYSAFQAVKENGYDIAKIEAKASNNQILYDEVNKCFAYMNGKNLEYYPNSTKSDKTTPAYQLWAVYTDQAKAVESENSVYWNGATAFNGTVKAGFDAGDTSGNTVKYESANSVVIRTNGGDLTVNASNGHVEHYGLAKTITVTAISDTTYVEHGTVATLKVGAGAKRVVIKSTAVVVNLENDTNAGVSVENNGYVGTATNEDKVSGNVGGDTIKVSTFDQLQGLALSSTMGNKLDGKTIMLTADIDMTGKTWTPFGFRAEKNTDNYFSGTIDGQGHKIIGLSNGNYRGAQTTTTWTKITGETYGFIAYAKGDVTVKNITFENVNINSDSANACAVVVGRTEDTDSLTLENVKVTGSVAGQDKVAGLVGYLISVKNANISNCTVDATISARNGDSYRAGGLFGFVSTSTVTVEGCSYKGNVTADTKEGYGSWCGLLTSGCAGSVSMTVKDCAFSGTAKTVWTKTGRTVGCTLNDQCVVGPVAHKGTSNFSAAVELTTGTFTVDNLNGAKVTQP